MPTLRERAALLLWSAVLRLAAPALLARWWWRGRQEPGYRVNLLERLGCYRRSTPAAGWVWLHAVSLGETRAAQPLIEALRRREPGLRLLLTQTTATGREAAQTLLRDGDALAWLPIDTPGAVARFYRHWQPRLGLLMETEVWPNLLASPLAPPIHLVNARLSDKSLRQGRRFAALLGGAARRLAGAQAQSPADARRLVEMGVSHVEVAGNLKFDAEPAASLVARGRSWRHASTPVLLAAITREGEEEALLAAWHELPQPRPRLLVVPRHPQRFEEVAQLLGAPARRSQWGDGGPDAQAQTQSLWLGDSMREMPLYYGLADVALLGGSFGPYGAHNLIEAAACGCPLVVGPSTFNFAQAAELSIAAGAARQVASAREALSLAQQLLQDKAALHTMREAALAFAAAHRGAADRMAERVLGPVPHQSSLR
ncbi:3-deoxy-D-manno-octulosonic acid transferase [Inhella gelatinilytica]|uniref:3-deoxy-D-manno-octulosonic acid transferase n=1 Tax=Inhella gelatinilytica TaxID=2795030 RepID=A0A931IWQ8_9BURK|nr:3-deoxy-D-manno-octulosonic acid transferase [Inhella gelatinilytica]MBH9552971.1 3-deoxy-D-manno-octulosonic acid transferase [Inhella gelatinilytica]